MESNQEHDLFLRLLARYERQIRLYVRTLVPRSVDVDDVVQETTVLLWKKFEQYDTSRPFLTWACKFAYFEVLKHRQRQARRKTIFSDELVELMAEERQAHEAMLATQEEALKDCLTQLPASDQELIQLRYGSEVTISELAEQISAPASRLYRELARIRRVLAGCVTRKLTAEGWSGTHG